MCRPREMDALETYVGESGRLMYLGGNGFYWLVSYDPERPYLMEVQALGERIAPAPGVARRAPPPDDRRDLRHVA